MNKMFFIIALLLISSSASATFITYGNRTAFEATLGTIVRDDYENPGYSFHQLDAGMSAVLGETRYTATGHLNNNLVPTDSTPQHYYCAGCNGSYLMDFTSTSVSGGGGVFGVGFDYFNGDGLVLYHAFVTFADNSTADFALNQVSFGNFNFFGITSNQLIKTMHLGLANGGTTVLGSFGQDNLTLGNNGQKVPEPATLTLMGLGLAGLNLFRRRKAA